MSGFIFLNYRFAPSWSMAILAGLAISFLSYLGLWQLDRAHQKQKMIMAQTQQMRQLPIAWHALMNNPQQYQQITITGDYMPFAFLLDNQHYQHQFGYNVLTPVLISPDNIVLVDRGWVAGNTDRRQLPSVTFLQKKVLLTGQVYYPSANPLLLGDAYEQKTNNLVIIESIDTQLISQFLHKSVYPFIIRMSKTAANGYTREWPVVSMPPERHNAYALQWFLMAFVVLIIFIGLHVKKIDEHHEA